MLEDHYTTPWFDVSIMNHTHKHRTPPREPALDLSRICSLPATALVVQYVLMVHGLLVSDDDTVLKSVQTISLLSIT